MLLEKDARWLPANDGGAAKRLLAASVMGVCPWIVPRRIRATPSR
jgi:hypothetical protein